MRGAGVQAGRDVVVYDDADATIAARAWWLLRYFGFGRDGTWPRRVLDGGFAPGRPPASRSARRT